MEIKNIQADVAIIGGGPAGLSAAKAAAENGAQSIIVIERDRELGGILQQCIHNGFGLHLFKEELTGPAYAERCYDLVKNYKNVKFLIDTMAINITPDKTIVVTNPNEGLSYIKAKAIVLAMGCRERTRGAIRIAGSRPAGVFTAGAAQRMVNMEGVLPGSSAVILGSGDIGLIMARRLSLEGVKVLACIELMPYSNGLTRNIVQCLEDYDIPLYLSHTISQIHGNDRVTGITCTKVDENFCPVVGSEFDIECDTILLSVGLIPENELSREIDIAMDNLTAGPIVDQNRQTNISGIFAAGNVLHVHDLADFASEEAVIAGKAAALYAQDKLKQDKETIPVVAGDGLRTAIPQFLNISDNFPGNIKIFLRAAYPQDNVSLQVISDDKVIQSRPLVAARPSEMLTAVIPEKDVAKIKGQLKLQLVGR